MSESNTATVIKVEPEKKLEDKSREIIAYIRERDEVRKELQKAQDELIQAKSRLYDANSRIEELEKALSKSKKGGQQQGKSGGGGKNAKATDNKKGGKSSTGNKKSSTDDNSETSKLEVPILEKSKSSISYVHPPIAGKEELSDDTCGYYWEIANRFPHMKMQQILDAEKKFSSADLNNDGVIDREELNSVLTRSTTFVFTQQTIEELIKEIDQDDDGTLDFIEVLTILDKASRRRLKINQDIQKNQTSVCSIQ